MRAVVCEHWGHYRDMSLRDMPAPALRPGTVRIGVHYAAASFGTTVMVAGKYQRAFELPFVPGVEVAGVVLEAADDVRRFSPGDRVCAALDHGGLADEAIATADTVYPVPDEVGLDTAAAMPLTYGTACAALRWAARLRRGQTLLVNGAAGGVGLAAVEIGRQLGAEVIAVASSADKLRAAAQRGAAHTLLADAELVQRVKALTGQRGVDVVIDPVGGAAFEAALHCLAQHGRIVVIGFASGQVPQIAANVLLVKNATVTGFNFGQYVGWGRLDERRRHARRVGAMMRELLDWTAGGALRPAVAARFALPRFADAFDEVLARRSVGRVLIEVGAAGAAMPRPATGRAPIRSGARRA